ncbi:hypothetical protein M0R45_011070 [Rubus argutus]|uniref:Uncharacterized protein n=1 Tax=Rubus argutus TaxID=59490 RepID=A0AAW1YA12_RUBAR
MLTTALTRSIGPKLAKVPSDDRTPVVPDNEDLVLIGGDGVQQHDEISDHVEARVGRGQGSRARPRRGSVPRSSSTGARVRMMKTTA